jgi:hypothetical protein
LLVKPGGCISNSWTRTRSGRSPTSGSSISRLWPNAPEVANTPLQPVIEVIEVLGSTSPGSKTSSVAVTMLGVGPAGPTPSTATFTRPAALEAPVQQLVLWTDREQVDPSAPSGAHALQVLSNVRCQIPPP